MTEEGFATAAAKVKLYIAGGGMDVVAEVSTCVPEACGVPSGLKVCSPHEAQSRDVTVNL